MQRLTRTLIARLGAETKDRDIVDSELRGFGVRIRAGLAPTFYFRYQSPTRKKIRRLSIGSARDIDIETAREIAREYRGYVAKGIDPEDGRRAAAGEGATVRDLFDRFMVEHVRRRNKRSSQIRTEWLWNRSILPEFSARAVRSITRGDVLALLSRIESAVVSNRTRASLSKAMNLAEAWEMRPDGSNPCRHVPKHREAPRERAVTPDELRRLWEALDTNDDRFHPVTILAKLVILTGARQGELRAARLEDIDRDRKLLYLRDSKTGKGEIELTDEALAVIDGARRCRASRQVVPGYGPGPLLSPWGAWREIVRQAGIEDLRLHDLRHLFGTYAHHAGATQRQIMDLLRHTTFQTSQRYVQGFKVERRRGAELTVRAIMDVISTPSEAPRPDNPRAPASSLNSQP